MKYLKPFNKEVWFIDKINKYKIDKICKKYGIKDYTINPDVSIDVNDTVSLWDKKLTKLPLKFNKVNGGFYCNDNKITSLEGCPKEVNGGFYCSNNQLTSFEFAPKRINSFFNCSYNKLTTLEGSPVEVNGNFSCGWNKLTSFEFAPKIIRGWFDCTYNNIKSFEYFPSYVKNNFYCTNNPIYEVWKLFEDTTKIELLNDFDIFRDEDTDTPAIVMDRLNDFLLTIGKKPVEYVSRYKNI